VRGTAAGAREDYLAMEMPFWLPQGEAELTQVGGSKLHGLM